MIPYSYGNIYSSISIYIPILLAILVISITDICLIKRKRWIVSLSNKNRMEFLIGLFALVGTLCVLLVTVPYEKMSPSNENANYEVVGVTEFISCDTENQTVTVMKDGVEVTEPTLITISYDDPHLEVRRYKWLGIYRDYNVTLIASPDAVKTGETSTDTDATNYVCDFMLPDATVTDANESTTETTEE